MDIDSLRERVWRDIDGAGNSDELEAVRLRYFGRKEGEVTALLRTLKDLSLEERKTTGPAIQRLAKEAEDRLREKADTLGGEDVSDTDLTAPAARAPRGHLHPLTQIEEEVRRIFRGMNFSVADGPEVESDFYNFEALNMPEGHPARDMWDTFWIKTNSQYQKAKSEEKLLLRTHTSPVQVRYMQQHKPPFHVIIPGRVSRYEATDQTHGLHFLNIEGLMVGKDIDLSNFKFVIEAFFRKFFADQEIEFRYRPSYFPFVEPGVELDIKLKGKWLEVMGAGMVHQRVFEHAGYKKGEWQGFAFGMGAERLAMIRHGIPDVRLFYSADLRFIHQF